ncbi:MAG: HAMP domain-containing histidine kinase [Bacteroidetes bacterium]|nr:HAMP domain-containing histidine kinase [Bacteroidota bacterium]
MNSLSKTDKERLQRVIEMISSMASLDFSERLDTEITNDPIDVISYGLNMLSEELEHNVVKKSKLEEINMNLEKFSYTVAHDLKSPLNTISALISLIEMENEKIVNSKIQEYIHLIKETNDRSRNMVNGILEYSRLNFRNVSMQKIDFGELCSKIAKEYSINKRVIISIDTPMPEVYYDETALTQVLNNLLSNAIKHNDKDLCKIGISAIDKENHYEIRISDNGPGILDEQKNKIFNLFENQNSRNSNSTGIGLAIVKRIINETYGSIEVESDENKGATFIFTIQKKEE